MLIQILFMISSVISKGSSSGAFAVASGPGSVAVATSHGPCSYAEANALGPGAEAVASASTGQAHIVTNTVDSNGGNRFWSVLTPFSWIRDEFSTYFDANRERTDL